MSKFWKNKQVLITGGSGFVGSHLILKLVELEAKVAVLNHRQLLENQILKKAVVAKINQTIIGDIGKKSVVFAAFKQHQPEFCFHLAAQPLVEFGEKNPLPTFETNVMGTANVLEAARQYQTKGVVLASTTHVYGKNKNPLLEKYFPRPSRPYETSKACADMIAQTYANYYNLPVSIARFSNIFGPGDLNQRLIPRCIDLLSHDQSPILYNGRVTRDFLYIKDAITAYLALAQKTQEKSRDQANIIYNFGTGKRHTTREVVNLIADLMNKSHVEIQTIDRDQSAEIVNQYPAVTKAQQVLGWQAQFSLEQGLVETLKWMKLLK